jgi:hypothetical protein
MNFARLSRINRLEGLRCGFVSPGMQGIAHGNEEEIPGPPGEADPGWGLRGLGPEECPTEICRVFRPLPVADLST